MEEEERLTRFPSSTKHLLEFIDTCERDLVRSSEVHIGAECEIYPCVSLIQMP